MVSQELLDILRCPNCVREGPEAGLLDREGNWLICTSCDRKYPIRDDIPVMLLEEGDRFQGVSRKELPEIPPPEERRPVEAAPGASSGSDASGPDDQEKLFLTIVGLVVGTIAVLVLIKLLTGRRSE